MKKQWSGYFQRLLFEQRHRIDEHKRIDALDEKFEDLKAAILSSIENVDQRETANGIVRYRRLSELLFSLHLSRSSMLDSNNTFKDLLVQAGIVDTVPSFAINPEFERRMSPRTFLLQHDGSFFEIRCSIDSLYNYEDDRNSFKVLSQKSKEIILDALNEMYRPGGMYVRYHREPFEKYIDNYLMRTTRNSDE